MWHTYCYILLGLQNETKVFKLSMNRRIRYHEQANKIAYSLNWFEYCFTEKWFDKHVHDFLVACIIFWILFFKFGGISQCTSLPEQVEFLLRRSHTVRGIFFTIYFHKLARRWYFIFNFSRIAVHVIKYRHFHYNYTAA